VNITAVRRRIVASWFCSRCLRELRMLSLVPRHHGSTSTSIIVHAFLGSTVLFDHLIVQNVT
jgi:hypothetical protein